MEPKQRRIRDPRSVVAALAAASLFLLAGGLLFFAGCGDDDDTAMVTGDFVALTYNVAGLPQGISGSNPEVNTPIIAPLLNDYDLVLLQETWQTPDPNPLAPTRVYHEILAAASLHPYMSDPLPLPLNQNPDRPSAIVSDGLNRFSQFPFGELERRRWQGCDDSAADCLSLKGFSVARTELAPGACVDVYNLHGEAGDTENDRDLKDQNTRDLIDFMLDYSDGRAVIVGGDFNMRLRRERDAANLKLLEDEAGLSDACVAVGVVDDAEIDKFFFRSNDRVTIAPRTCRFENERFVDPQGEPLSDHEPLAVEFDWTASAGDATDCL
jgi:endonuclease/exonuclease/phosphatase family metal-dependent hydrolase